MPGVPCAECGGPTAEGRGDYVELCRPEVAIRDIPALTCETCGACYFPPEVLRRLSLIVDEAQDLAATEGLRDVRWAYTVSGPPDLGALPAHVREFFGGLRESMAWERFLAEATERAGRETPSAFH